MFLLENFHFGVLKQRDNENGEINEIKRFRIAIQLKSSKFKVEVKISNCKTALQNHSILFKKLKKEWLKFGLFGKGFKKRSLKIL